MTPISYLQTDKKWSSCNYSAKGESTTIGKSGCGITCSAMVIASITGNGITPKETAKWSMDNGYKAYHQGTYYTYFKPQMAKYGVACKQLNSSSIYGNTKSAHHTTALNAVKQGNWVICCMGKGNWTSSGHFILWYGMEGNTALIRDPNSTKTARVRGNLALLQSQVKYYFIVTVTDKTEKDDEMVENRKINILGKEYTTKGIFKDNSNYVSPKVLSDAGFIVTANGTTPVISMPQSTVNINGKEVKISMVNSGGTTYCGIRELAEALGHKVGWDGKNVTIS